MGNHNEPSVWQEIVQGAGKILTWLAYISIGVFAKLAFDSRQVKLTRRSIIIKTVLSIFCGFVAAQICEQTGHISYIGWICPVATLLGESIIVYLMTHWKALTFRFISGITNNKTKK